MARTQILIVADRAARHGVPARDLTPPRDERVTAGRPPAAPAHRDVAVERSPFCRRPRLASMKRGRR